MTPTRLAALHTLWHELSGLTLPKWSVGIMHRWERLWHEVGPIDVEPEEALRLVVARIRREAKQFHGYYALLSFYKITDASRFQEQLAYAIAEARKPAPSANVIAMQTLTGKKYERPSPPARKADEILQSEAFKEFVKLRDNL